jgi:hypothetical protein
MLIQILFTIAVDLIIVLGIIKNKIHIFSGINILLIISYNILGWSYIFKYMDVGGASLGPGLLLIVATILHILMVFFISIIITFRKRKKLSK